MSEVKNNVIIEHDNDEKHLSECCNERLTYYDWRWYDGVCPKCNHHSPAKKKEKE